MRNNQKIPDESDINEAENIINTPSDDTFLDIKDELKKLLYNFATSILAEGTPVKKMSKAKKYYIALENNNPKFTHRIQNNFAQFLIKEFAQTTNIEFYKNKASLFEQIWTYYEMLLEAVAMLSLDCSREIGIYVINAADVSWQLIQELLKQNGIKFSELIKTKSTPIQMELFDIINEIFDMHCALRHPVTKNKGQYNWIFDKKWSIEHIEKVRIIGQTLIQILDCLKFELNPDMTFLKATKEEKQQIIQELYNE